MACAMGGGNPVIYEVLALSLFVHSPVGDVHGLDREFRGRFVDGFTGLSGSIG